MRRLTKRIQNWAQDIEGNETGATLVFVAVVLVALLALGAFAVDFGRMYEERRQLQNGADAAALAIAEDCARGLCGSGYDEYAVAETYVDTNARDGAANAWLVDLDLSAQTVTVHNRTEDLAGDNQFDMLLAGIVGFDGFTVGAEATVAWGYPLQFPVIPIIFSECEWERSADSPWGGAGGGSNLWPDPPDYATTPYHTMVFHNPQNPQADEPDLCAGPAGQDLPGGFGYLATSGSCDADVYGVEVEDDAFVEYGWVQASPGNSPDCDAAEIASIVLDEYVGRTVFIPYFDEVWNKQEASQETGDPNPPSPCEEGPAADDKCYHISGYGAFHVVGYKFGGDGGGNDWVNILFDPPVSPPLKPGGQPWPENQWEDKFVCVTPEGPQTDATSCLMGYFVDTVYSGPADLGGEDRGVKVIKFTG
jgi:hypothetical protein